MPVLIADLSTVTEQAPADLVGVAEDETLEFKRDTSGTAGNARRELCKDVSALANTRGGDIVLGIDEVDAVASAIVELDCADINGEIQRLQNIISMAIEPVVLSVRFRSIPISNGQPALFIRASKP